MIQQAVRFIVLLGLVSLFADITYEGARSILGPFLSTLGASAAIVGTVSGFGECIGYSVRLFSGYLTDKTKKYWFLTILGYSINLFAVPLLAFANTWQAASGLIILERFGKAIRNPARDVMLSYASKETGRGWGFGLHALLDQMGAIIGPLVIAGILLWGTYSYQTIFAFLFIPAIVALILLTAARLIYPQPRTMEKEYTGTLSKKFSKKFWIYLMAVSLVAAGYVDFPLIAYHFKKNTSISDWWIPLLYSIAMGMQGLAALIFGRLFDAKGLVVSIYSTIIGLLFVPFTFLDGLWAAIFGMVFWGIGMGGMGTVMRAAIADFVHIDRRGTAYGILNIAFGVSWFLGSSLMGILYDYSIDYLVIFSFVAQIASIPLLTVVKNMK